MDGEEAFDHLIEASIVEIAGDDGKLQMAQEFQDTLQAHQSEISDRGDCDLHGLVSEVVTNEQVARTLLDAGRDEQIVIAYVLALADHLENQIDGGWIQTLPVLVQLRGDPPRAEGSPQAFLPIHGGDLIAFEPLFAGSIVYVWREDCKPCDQMRDIFDVIFEHPPDDLSLFAVYGPGAPQALWDTYGVAGGPTTLFIIDGEVDARLQGPHDMSVVEREVEALRRRMEDGQRK